MISICEYAFITESKSSNTSFEILMAMVSSRIAFFASVPKGTWIAVGCSACACLISCYVMERAFFWFLDLISFTHGGVVTENRRHCVFLSFALPAPSRTTSTSSEELSHRPTTTKKMLPSHAQSHPTHSLLSASLKPTLFIAVNIV